MGRGRIGARGRADKCDHRVNKVRIVIRALDVRAGRQAQDRLADCGVEAPILLGDAGGPDGVDVALVAIGSTAPREAAAFADAATCAHPTLCVVAGALDAPVLDAALGLPAPFDAWVALDAPPALLKRRIKSIYRAAVAREESARRAATANALALSDEFTAAPSRRLKALFVGAPNPFFLALERAWGARGGYVTAAFSSFSGFDHLHDEQFDAVALNAVDDAPTAIALCAALRRNASLNNLPTLVLTRARDAGTVEAVIARGASVTIGEDESSDAALSWLFESVRHERGRREVERALNAWGDRLGDVRTGLFTAPSFTPHLARLAEDHQESGRPLSVIAMRIDAAPGARAPAPVAWDKGFTEVATLTGRLIRDVDCAAVVGPDIIACALPATTLSGARRAAERIASVGECTAFAAGDEGGGPLVFEQSIAELKPGEGGAGLLARALDAIHCDALRA